MKIVQFKNVTRTYVTGDHTQDALAHVDLEIEGGKFVVILGPSGAGKSTFLNLLGGLDNPTSGTIIVDDTDISTLSSDELADYRAAKVGFVFQSYNLIPTLTVLENISLVEEIAPDHMSAEELLTEVGLDDHAHKILLCDEPTGALDSETGVVVLKLLLKMARDYGKTIIIVTHNQNIARMADIVIHIRSGKVTSVVEQPHPLSAEEVDW